MVNADGASITDIRIVGETIAAGQPVPAHTNAAVDGYAFASRHYDRSQTTELPVSGRAAAGHPLVRQPQEATAARILTGAVMPDGTDTVVMQEWTIRSDDRLYIHQAPPQSGHFV